MLRNMLLLSVGAIALAGSQALAADLPSRAPPPVFLPPAAVFSWTGFYAGLNAGYAWANDPVSAFVPGPPNNFSNGSTAPLEATIVGTGGLHPSGFIGGGQLGYNWQINRFVVGLEGDIDGLTGNATRDSGDLVGFTARFKPRKLIDDVDHVHHDWFATVRGRLGYAITERALVYATGGLALTQDNFSRDLAWSYIDPCPTGAGGLHQCHVGSISQTMAGWTVGGGIEYAIANNWTIKAEYLHAGFGHASFSTFNPTRTPPQQIVHTIGGSTFDIARAGINYKFDWGAPAPVVARY